MKKYLVVFTIVCLVLSLSLPIYAEESPEWSLSNDLSTLSCGEDVYHLYAESIDAKFVPICLSIVAECVTANGVEYDVGIYRGRESVAYLLDSYTWELRGIYVKGNGASVVDDFRKGSYTDTRLTDGFMDAPIEWGTVAAWDARADERKGVNVTELDGLEVYEIVRYDATLCLGYVYGAVYILDDGYIYVNYHELDNSYFDSEGNFSYRRGEVDVLYLEGEAAEEVDEVLSLLETTVGFEYDTVLLEADPVSSFLLFVILWALLGIALPAGLIVAGALLSSTKKPFGGKHWRVLIIVGILWIIAASAILAILLIQI